MIHYPIRFSSVKNNNHLEIAERTTLFDEVNIQVTASFGIATAAAVEIKSENTMRKIMNKADQALYLSKRNGRNCVERGSMGTVLTASVE